MTKSVGVHEAKTHLSRLLERVVAGEEIVITRRGKEVARLVPSAHTDARLFGLDRGRLVVPDDFDAPLPDDVIAAFRALRLLLDTHVFLWLLAEPERLGAQLPLVQDPAVELLVSAASSWEIAIKHGLGRLPLPDSPERYVPDRIRAIGATPLAIEHRHALAIASLPALHGDPFDRLLVAQAKLLDIEILTADPVIARYPVRSRLIG